MKAFLRSFVYAGRGVWFCIRHERNFRFHMVAAIYVLCFAPLFSLTRGEWAALLARYGQSVALHRGEETVRTQAFLQAVTERDRAQEAPSPLGLRREDRFLYLGKPEEPLTPGCWVEWNGTGYEVQTAHPIQAGGRTSHVWAVLRPRDREAGA